MTYDWDAVRRAIMRHANLHRFDTRVELRKVATDFIEQNWPSNAQPTDRAIRDFLMPIAEDLSLL